MLMVSQRHSPSELLDLHLVRIASRLSYTLILNILPGLSPRRRTDMMVSGLRDSHLHRNFISVF
jgi:hypothetical protein